MQQSKTKQANSKKGATRTKGIVRIIGGNMRGRKLRFNTIEGLRPTLDRTRETLFNWLSRDIAGSKCLDLFAGSGALGFEALSRNAQQVTLVERSARVARDLKDNCQLLKVDNVKVINLDAIKFLACNHDKFDLIFLDPPFGKGLLDKMVELIPQHLGSNGLLYIEQENSKDEFNPDENWEQVKYKKTSSFSYALYRFVG